MFARHRGFVLEAFAFECYPINAHGFHILFGEGAGFFSFEPDHLRYLLARVRPVRGGKGGARVVRAFRIFHHLPKPFQTGVALAVENEGRGSEIGKQAEFVAFGEDNFAGTSFLWEYLPRRSALFRNWGPPMAWVLGMEWASSRSRGGADG